MKRLEWEFQLVDRVSGAAKQMRLSLEGVDDALKRVNTSTQHAGHGAESLTTKMHSLMGIGERIWRVGEGVAHIGESFGEAAIEAASFKEETVVALGTILGSSKQAGRVLHDTVALAAHLPIETQDAIQATTKLALAGYGRKDLMKMTVAAADVKALNPGRGEEAMRYFVRHLDEVQQVGLQHRHLRFLSQEANLPEEGILRNLSKAYGGASPEALKKAMAKGLIDKNAAVWAILQTVADKEGGKLGTLSKKLSATVPGLLSTLRSRKLELLMDLDESPAYASLRGFLSNLANALDPASAFGHKAKDSLARTFGGVFSRLFGDFSGADGAVKLEEVLTKALRAVDLLGVALQAGAGLGKGFFTTLGQGLGISNDLFGADGSLDAKKVEKLVLRFEVLGKTIGDMVLHLLDLAKLIGSVLPTSTDVSSSVGIPGLLELTFDKQGNWSGVDILKSHEDKAKNLGKASARGYALGINTDTSPVTAVEQMGDASTAAMAKALDAHSPSRVFQRFGQWTAQGFSLGVQANTGDASAAIAGMVQTPDGGGAGLRGSPITIQVTLQVQVQQATPGQVQGLVDRLRTELPNVLVEAAQRIQATSR
jgi:hypothetical protein